MRAEQFIQGITIFYRVISQRLEIAHYFAISYLKKKIICSYETVLENLFFGKMSVPLLSIFTFS